MQKLVENVIRQADFLLKEQGEFYPFATVISSSGELVPLGLTLDTEHPDASLVLDLLKKSITEGIKHGKFSTGAIAANVSIGGLTNFSDGLQIEITQGINHSVKTLCLPYQMDAETGAIRFGKFIDITHL